MQNSFFWRFCSYLHLFRYFIYFLMQSPWQDILAYTALAIIPICCIILTLDFFEKTGWSFHWNWRFLPFSRRIALEKAVIIYYTEMRKSSPEGKVIELFKASKDSEDERFKTLAEQLVKHMPLYGRHYPSPTVEIIDPKIIFGFSSDASKIYDREGRELFADLKINYRDLRKYLKDSPPWIDD